MDLDNKRVYEDLKIRLRSIEAEERRLEEELEKTRAEKQMVLEQMGKQTDQKFEENALAMLYEQRRGKK